MTNDICSINSLDQSIAIFLYFIMAVVKKNIKRQTTEYKIDVFTRVVLKLCRSCAAAAPVASTVDLFSSRFTTSRRRAWVKLDHVPQPEMKGI